MLAEFIFTEAALPTLSAVAVVVVEHSVRAVSTSAGCRGEVEGGRTFMK